MGDAGEPSLRQERPRPARRRRVARSRHRPGQNWPGPRPDDWVLGLAGWNLRETAAAFVAPVRFNCRRRGRCWPGDRPARRRSRARRRPLLPWSLGSHPGPRLVQGPWCPPNGPAERPAWLCQDRFQRLARRGPRRPAPATASRARAAAWARGRVGGWPRCLSPVLGMRPEQTPCLPMRLKEGGWGQLARPPCDPGQSPVLPLRRARPRRCSP